VGKIDKRTDFSLASSKLTFAKKISANRNLIIYNCVLNFKKWKCCVRVRVHVCFLGTIFPGLLKRKIDFRVGKRGEGKSWQN